MPRRAFLQVAGASAAAMATSGADAKAESATQPSDNRRAPLAAAYGLDRLYDASEPYVLQPGPHLFVDWRYVSAGGISWQDPQGKPVHYFTDKDPKDVTWKAGRAPYGIKLVNQKATKIGPIIPNDREWEYCIYSYLSLFDLGGKFGLWYEVVPPGEIGRNDIFGSHQDLLCYAESTDGVNWNKPELGLVEYNGSNKNNIVFNFSGAYYKTGHGINVWIDLSAPANERFKCVFMCFPPGEEIFERMAKERPISVSRWGRRKHSAIQFGSSPDGFHWSFNDKIAMVHMSDTETICYYDEFIKRYVGYFRTSCMGRRAIGRSESTDLYDWPTPETVLWAHGDDEADQDYYNNSRCMYPGTKDMHLMFPTIYHRRTESCTLRMASSLEGMFWQWVPGGDVVGYGATGEWDAECIFGGCGLVEIPGDRVVFPFTGYEYAHKFPRYPRAGQIGLASWKKERLCALQCDEEGEFWTNQMSLPGKTLYLNFETRQAGYIRVEVMDVEGRKIDDCDPLSGDKIKSPVTWHGESALNVPEGKPAVLHFRMRAAKLFSFEIK
jgi:hypothetical protein